MRRFDGNQVIYLAARDYLDVNSSGWQPLAAHGLMDGAVAKAHIGPTGTRRQRPPEGEIGQPADAASFYEQAIAELAP